MKRSITFFVVLAVVALVTLAARASQDPTAATPFDQGQSAAAAITITSVPASMGTLEQRIQRGFTIAPVPLNLRGKNVAFVGLGSGDSVGALSAPGPGTPRTNPALRTRLWYRGLLIRAPHYGNPPGQFLQRPELSASLCEADIHLARGFLGGTRLSYPPVLLPEAVRQLGARLGERRQAISGGRAIRW